MRSVRCATSPATIAVLLALALAHTQTALADDKLLVYTVNYPLAYFAERIAGTLAEVKFPAPPDVDPAFWIPDAETIAAYQTADLVLLNGAGYAKWTAKVSLPRFRLVNTSRGFEREHMRVVDGVSHSHGPGGAHSHGGTASVIWLDLNLATKQARAIAEALTRKRPGEKRRVEQNLGAIEEDLLALDQTLAAIAKSDQQRPLLASHPVYHYLARRYGLNLKSVTWEPDKMPTGNQWAELKDILQDHPAKGMLWESQPSKEIVERLRRLGVDSLVFDPAGNRPQSGDFLSVMQGNAANLKRAFRSPGL